MTSLDKLKVSLTKNGFNKIGDVLYAVGPNDLLTNLSGQVNGAHIDESQVKGMLDFDDVTGTFPGYWETIHALGENAVQKCVFVSVIFSHVNFIEEFTRNKTAEMRGVVRRSALGDKAYTNVVAFMAKLGMTLDVKGDDERPYNLSPLFTDPTLGPYYKQIIERKLRRCGWPGANDSFTRDFYEQSIAYGFPDVLAISSHQYHAWLEGHVVEVEEAPVAQFSAQEVSVSASLLLALASKPFAILAGATGTGKTRTARQLASALRPEGWTSDFNTAFVPVAAGWTDGRHLLGYRTPFGPRGEQYMPTALLRLLLRANHAGYSHVPFFIILDEMNLSQVEMYFSSFLSLMEVAQAGEKEPVLGVGDLELLLKSRMHDGLDGTFADEAIRKGGVYLTKNVFVIGTVNVDDTTHTFSPKVLDRAFVLEYQPPSPSLTGADFAILGSDVARAGQDMLSSLLLPEQATVDATTRPQTLEALDEIFYVLGRYKFGPRTTNEIARYVYITDKAIQSSIIAPRHPSEIIDSAILAKILPKLQGSRAMLNAIIIDLLKVAEARQYIQSKLKLSVLQRELGSGYANYFSI